MKTIKNFLVFITFCIINNANANCSNNVFLDTPRLVHYNYDTAQYFQKDFNDSNSLYVNKPFKNLLKKIELKPIFYFGLPDIKNRDSLYIVDVYFVNWNRYANTVSKRSKQKIYKLQVSFTKALDMNTFLFDGKNYDFHWNSGVKAFLSNAIIKEYMFYY